MTPEEFYEKWEPADWPAISPSDVTKREFMEDLASLVIASGEDVALSEPEEETEYQKLKCLSCNRTLESDANPNPFVVSPVYGGVRFRTNGNYGSDVFDPMPVNCEDMLEVVVCDNCLKKKASRVTVIKNIRRKTTATREEFKP